MRTYLHPLHAVLLAGALTRFVCVLLAVVARGALLVAADLSHTVWRVFPVR